MTSQHVDLRQFIDGYVSEMEELVPASETNLLAIEQALGRGEPSPRAVRDLYRALHTMKGLSAMVGIEPIVEIAHEMETVVRAADQTAGRLGASAIEALLEGLKAIEQRVGAVSQKKPVAPAPPVVLERLATFRQPGSVAPAAAAARIELEPRVLERIGPAECEQLARGASQGHRTMRLDFAPSPERAARSLTIASVRERLSGIADVVKIVPLSAPPGESAPTGVVFAILLVTDATDDALTEAAGMSGSFLSPIPISWAPPEPITSEPPPVGPASDELEDMAGRLQRRGIVRVDVGRLDDALEKLSALVVSRFRFERAIADLAARGVDVRAVSEIIGEHRRQLRDLRASLMRARLVPVTEVIGRVPLIVRELQRATGKLVHLDLYAGSAELDKAVAERIFPAIVHLVRNAIDHAIEPPSERERAGKPREGRVCVACHERANQQLELSVSDDGRGIDRTAVARLAGRPIANDDALLELLTTPGLSTASEATRTSGRGLGMDIVRRIAVDELGGELAFATEPGKGTTFTLRIPLSLTIVDAFSFVCGAHRFVVPVASVDAIVDVNPAEIRSFPKPQAGLPPVSMLSTRGEIVPLFPLAAALDETAPETPAASAIIVRRGSAPFAFGVDRVVGQQEVVVRPLADPLVRVPGVCGSTDLGDGAPTLVLDLVSLATRYRRVAEAM